MMLFEEVPLGISTMVPEAAGCRVLVLQEGDDPALDFPQAGKYGLLTHLDDCWQEPFAWVRVVTVRECRLFVAQLVKSYEKGKHVVVVPDAEWVDERLLLVLRMEAEEVVTDSENCASNASIFG
jgi:hypothetical protein